MLPFCSAFAYGAGGWGSNFNEVISLIDMSVMVLEAVTFHSFFTCGSNLRPESGYPD
jgi:hypothetical protein